MKKIHPDIEMLQIVARALGPLREKVVFVGGATTTLYVDDPASPESVATLDVDCVVEISGALALEALEKQMRRLGFKHPIGDSSAPICRWKWGEVSVDLMPSDPRLLGFSNRWYEDGIRNRKATKLPDETSIFVFSLPFFIASKLEAVKGRGGADLRFSHDWEDVVFVLSGASQAWDHLSEAPPVVLKYLKREWGALLKNPTLRESVFGFLAARGEQDARAVKVFSAIESFVKKGGAPQ